MSQINITQYPGQLNLANSDLIWEITSALTGSPQYQFVCALQDGCGNVLTTIKQQPNPSGKGVFNLGRIVKQYLDYDYTTLTIDQAYTTPFNKNSQTAKFFKVAFGEEYGATLSSSVTPYSGVGTNTGSAAYTGSTNYYYWINGTLDPDYGSWNWNTSSFYSPEPTPNTGTFSKNVALTDAPRTQYIQSTDYASISVLNGNLTGGTTTAQDIAWAEYTVYTNGTASNNFYENVNIAPPNTIYSGGPRVNSITQAWSDVASVQTCANQSGSQTSGSLLIHIGVGPKNLAFPEFTGSWDYYTVKLHPQSTGSYPGFNLNATWDTFTFIRQDAYCGYPGVRFAFINNYGVWDYFNFTLQNNKTTTLEKGTYKKNFVNYSTNGNSVDYNRLRRGTDTFYTNINENYQISSDWLTQEQADWLETLFYSPSVMVQDGDTWNPIVINDSTFVSKSNPRTQKNFQYIINYTLSNNKRSR